MHTIDEKIVYFQNYQILSISHVIFVYFTHEISQNYKTKIWLANSLFSTLIYTVYKCRFQSKLYMSKGSRVPNILKTFYKFGISNNLVPTLLLTFLKKAWIKVFLVNAWNPINASFKSFFRCKLFNHPPFWCKPLLTLQNTFSMSVIIVAITRTKISVSPDGERMAAVEPVLLRTSKVCWDH